MGERPEIVEMMDAFGIWVIQRAFETSVATDDLIDAFCSIMKERVIPSLLDITKH